MRAEAASTPYLASPHLVGRKSIEEAAAKDGFPVTINSSFTISPPPKMGGGRAVMRESQRRVYDPAGVTSVPVSAASAAARFFSTDFASQIEIS